MGSLCLRKGWLKWGCSVLRCAVIILGTDYTDFTVVAQ